MLQESFKGVSSWSKIVVLMLSINEDDNKIVTLDNFDL